MKKIFALALAAVMTAGMTTVAFAKNEEIPSLLEPNQGAHLFVMDDGEVKKDSALKDDGYVEGGDEIAIPVALLADEAGSKYDWYTIDSDFDKKLVTNEDWDVNKADTEFRFVKYEAGTLNTKAVRVYSLVITVPENDTNKVVDLAGSVSIGKTKSDAKKADKADVSVSIAPAAQEVLTYNGETLVAGETGIYKFDEDGEIDIEFGDQAMFTVDVTGQGKLNLAWNTDFDKEFAAMYDYANIDFVTFVGTPAFNKTGTLYIYADEDEFVYEVTADGAKAVKAEWNEDYEAWELKTRTLKSYAISDVELDEKTETEDKKDDSSSTTDGGKENPDTGR